jgi:ribose 5-phosphate isomerase B
MRVALAADHGGFPLKATVAESLRGAGIDVLDLGADQLVGDDDYPIFAERVARAVAEGRAERGVVICGSGVGASVAANKVHGVRAAVCHDTFSARQGVEDDDMNVLSLGARVIGSSLAVELVKTFVAARFSGAVRHLRRKAMVDKLDTARLR